MFYFREWGDSVTLRHLKIFIEVADCKKMSLAAKKLYITQPSVSQAIAETETYYGVKLFERLSKKLYITESGECLLKYARHIVHSFEEMEINIKHTGQNARLNIGGSVTVGTCLLGAIIERFEVDEPNVSTKVVIDNTTEMENRLLNSELDVAVIEGEIVSKDLVKLPIYQDHVIMVAGKNFKYDGSRVITLEELSTCPMLTREPGSRARNLYEQVLKEKGVTLNVKWSSTNTETIKNAAIRGQGMAILSSLLVATELKENLLHEVKVEGLNIAREICIVYHKNKYLSPNLLRFLEYCRAHTKEITKDT